MKVTNDTPSKSSYSFGEAGEIGDPGLAGKSMKEVVFQAGINAAVVGLVQCGVATFKAVALKDTANGRSVFDSSHVRKDGYVRTPAEARGAAADFMLYATDMEKKAGAK